MAMTERERERPRRAKVELPKGIILLNDGWKDVRVAGIDKLEVIIEETRQTRNEELLTFPREVALEIYTKVFLMCHQVDPYNWSKELYSRHGREMSMYLSESMAPAVQEQLAKVYSNNADGNDDSNTNPHQQEEEQQQRELEENKNQEIELLKEAVFQWHLFVFYKKWVTNFLRILDRVHADENNEYLPTLHKVSLRHFETIVFEPFLEEPLTEALLTLIRQDRDKQQQQEEGEKEEEFLAGETRVLLNQVLAMFKTMDSVHRIRSRDDGVEQVHLLRLEQRVLDDTRLYYATKRASLEWKYLDSLDYFTKANTTLQEEMARCQGYLHHFFVHQLHAESQLRTVILEELYDNAPVPPPQDGLKPSRQSGSFAAKRRGSGINGCVSYMPVVGFFAGATGCRTNTVIKQQKQQQQRPEEAPHRPARFHPN